MNKIKISILPNYFLNENGTFNKEEAIKLSGKIAGVCYDKEGFSHLENEPEEKTMRRVDMTLNNGHHSVYDHISISFNIQNIPKILAMFINNEHQYTTSEKSARYTPIIRDKNSIITEAEETLYNKWLEIFKVRIKEEYGYFYNDSKILKLAQENARYLVTVFMPTQMIYTTSLRQINYIASWMQEYIDQNDLKTPFDKKIVSYMKQFIEQLDELNILTPGLLKNEKHRSLSLIDKNIQNRPEIFSYVYCTNYKGSFAQLAQAHRHRTIDYQMQLLDKKEYYIPPIIADNENLVAEWLSDMHSVEDKNPQGELILINETGKYSDFILKTKERLCSAAQLEIMQQTKQTLLKYQKALEESNNPLAQDIVKYTHGARCTFPDFDCSADCQFKEGKTLKRKI